LQQREAGAKLFREANGVFEGGIGMFGKIRWGQDLTNTARVAAALAGDCFC
jgi:hypothetical protein